jgi:hypothetical protein
MAKLSSRELIVEARSPSHKRLISSQQRLSAYQNLLRCLGASPRTSKQVAHLLTSPIAMWFEQWM